MRRSQSCKHSRTTAASCSCDPYSTPLPFPYRQKNLPNKRSIGKQDPYAVLQFGAEVQKTKADKRGGQHPNWDEQLHFEIYDDLEDAMKKGIGSGDSTIKASSNTAQKSRKGKGGAKILKVSCYADDARDPELIGEGQVDLTETLKTGEFDGESRPPLRTSLIMKACWVFLDHRGDVRTILLCIALSDRMGDNQSKGSLCGRGLSRAHILLIGE